MPKVTSNNYCTKVHGEGCSNVSRYQARNETWDQLGGLPSPPLSPDTTYLLDPRCRSAAHASSPLQFLLSINILLCFESLPTIYTIPPCIRAYGSASNPTTLRTIGRGRATPYTTITAVQCTVPPHSIPQCLTRNIDTSVRLRRHRYPRMKKPLHLAMPRVLVPTKSATTPSGKVSSAQT
jgi:hypothetical protein